MNLPGDPNLPPGVTTRDTDGNCGPSEHTCPKCGSREVSDLHAPDLWCSECDYEWDIEKPEEQCCDLCGEPSNDLVETIPDDGPICRKCWDKHAADCRNAGADPGPLPLAHVAEYDAAAQWCAEQGLEGSLGDPLPANMATSGALCWIQADPEAFMERVKQCAYALAMTKVKDQ